MSKLTVADHERNIAQQILDLMERDGIQWIKPWATMRPFFNAASRHTYTGGNVFTLMLTSMVRGIEDPRFMTFKQARQLGGSVRKGAKGIPIIYYGTLKKEDDNGEERRARSKDASASEAQVARSRRFARISYVFPLADIDGLDEADLPSPGGDTEQNPDERLQACDAFFEGIGAHVHQCPTNQRALYAPHIDRIEMPAFEAFVSAEAFYATFAHEHIHWTGHKERLDRGLFADGFDYAFEELIAEIGAVFTCNRLGILPEPREENAAYVKGWMKRIRDKPQAFWSAASAAQKAADFLRNKALASEVPVVPMKEEAA